MSRESARRQVLADAEARGELAQVMREKELARLVIDAARTLGWRVFWTWNSLHSPKGWPDLVLLKPLTGKWEGHTRAIFAELKSEGGKLTREQEETLELLRGTGMAVYYWRPSDWLSGAIAEALS